MKAERISSSDANILLIEEHAANIIVLRKILSRFGLEKVFTASSGRVGLNMVTTTQPSVVLLDCSMPDMDGSEVARRIRDDERDGSKRVPIIGISAKATPQDCQTRLEAGMDHCAGKPINAAVLHELLSAYIDLPPFAGSVVSTSQDAEVDYGMLEQFARGGHEHAQMLLDAFSMQSEELLELMQTAIEQQDTTQWSIAAHALHGSAANIGANALGHLAAEAKEDGTAAAPAQTEALDAIRGEYARTCQAFKDYLASRA